jgi:RNA polymerase sigma-70 factor (ECF subfamily)
MSAARPTTINFPATGVYIAQDAEDAAAVRRCLEGDTASFGLIVERYQRVFFSVAVRMLGNADDANDAAQTAFVKAFKNLGTFDPRRRLFSWIYRILLNECHNRRRDRRPTEPITPEMVVGDSPADRFETEERRRRVQAAVLALPDNLREVIVLRHFAELSYEDIAETLHVAPSIVKSRLHTARTRLGVMLLGMDRS